MMKPDDYDPAYVALESDPICSSGGCTQYKHPQLFEKDKWPRDYFVPNFGEDFDIRASKKHLKEQEDKLGVWNLKEVDEIKRDYTVPNFGVDADILAAKASIASSETSLNHTWTPTQDENGFWEVPTPFDNRSYSYR